MFIETGSRFTFANLWIIRVSILRVGCPFQIGQNHGHRGESSHRATLTLAAAKFGIAVNCKTMEACGFYLGFGFDRETSQRWVVPLAINTTSFNRFRFSAMEAAQW